MNCVEFSSHLGLLGYSQVLSESGLKEVLDRFDRLFFVAYNVGNT